MPSNWCRRDADYVLPEHVKGPESLTVVSLPFPPVQRMRQCRSRYGSPIRSSGSEAAHPNDETGNLIMISGMGSAVHILGATHIRLYATVTQLVQSPSRDCPAAPPRTRNKHKKNVSLEAFLRGWDGSIAKARDQDIGDVALWRHDAVSRCFGSLYFWCLGLWR